MIVRDGLEQPGGGHTTAPGHLVQLGVHLFDRPYGQSLGQGVFVAVVEQSTFAHPGTSGNRVYEGGTSPAAINISAASRILVRAVVVDPDDTVWTAQSLRGPQGRRLATAVRGSSTINALAPSLLALVRSAGVRTPQTHTATPAARYSATRFAVTDV